MKNMFLFFVVLFPLFKDTSLLGAQESSQCPSPKTAPQDVRNKVLGLSSLVGRYVALLMEETQLIEETIEFMKRVLTKENVTKARQLIQKIEKLQEEIEEVSQNMEHYEVDSPLCIKHWAVQLKNLGYSEEAEQLVKLALKMRNTLKERDIHRKKPLYNMLARQESMEKFNRNFDALHDYQKKKNIP